MTPSVVTVEGTVSIIQRGGLIHSILSFFLTVTTLYLVWNTVRGRDFFTPHEPASFLMRVIYGLGAALLLFLLLYGWKMAGR